MGSLGSAVARRAAFARIFIPTRCYVVQLIAVGALLVAADAHATPINYSETASGDLPYLYPGSSTSVLNLGVGANTVSGTLSSPYDNDTFAFTVPQSTQVSSISLSFSQSTAIGYPQYPGLSPGATYGLSPGIGLPYAPYPNGNYAQNIYFSPKSTSPTILFPLVSPLGAGTYTTGDFVHNNFLSGYEDYTYTLNVQSLTPPPPPPPHVKNYGLFIGVTDYAVNADGTLNKSAPPLAGVLAAQELAQSFKNSGGYAESLTTDLLSGGSLSSAQITASIQKISSMMEPGDNFVLYVAGHGASQYSIPGGVTNFINDKGQGDEFIHLGTSYNLSDDDLTAMLQPLGDVNKWVLLDSCHSGGFWGPGDVIETGDIGGIGINVDAGDLNRLTKTMLLASSSETGLAYYDANGIPLISNALTEGFKIGADGFYAADLNHNGLDATDLAAYVTKYVNDLEGGYPGEVVYEAGFGDPAILTPGLVGPVMFESSDFSGTLSVNNVPEPPAIALLGIALASMFVARLENRQSSTRRTGMKL